MDRGFATCSSLKLSLNLLVDKIAVYSSKRQHNWVWTLTDAISLALGRQCPLLALLAPNLGTSCRSLQNILLTSQLCLLSRRVLSENFSLRVLLAQAFVRTSRSFIYQYPVKSQFAIPSIDLLDRSHQWEPLNEGPSYWPANWLQISSD